MNLKAQQAILEGYARIPGNCQAVHVRPYALRLMPTLGDRILDVGAYLGANLIHYARLGFCCVGVEAAKAYCDRFQEELEKKPTLKPRPVMLHGMIETVKIRGSFQAILCGEMICYCPDPEPPMRRMASLCDPGGVLLITVPKEPQQEYPTHFPLLDLERLVITHGFRPVLTEHLEGWAGGMVSAVRAIKESI